MLILALTNNNIIIALVTNVNKDYNTVTNAMHCLLLVYE